MDRAPGRTRRRAGLAMTLLALGLALATGGGRDVRTGVRRSHRVRSAPTARATAALRAIETALVPVVPLPPLPADKADSPGDEADEKDSVDGEADAPGDEADETDAIDREIDALCDEADRVFDRDPARARALLERAVSLDPHDSGIQEQLAFTLLAQGEDNDAARDAALECVRLAPDNPRCRRYAVTGMMRTGRFDDAEPYVRACMDERPDDAGCVASMLTLEIRRHHYAEVIALAARLRRLAPDGLDIHLADAMIAEHAHNRDEALAQYAIACDRGQPFACNRLAALRDSEAHDESAPNG